MTDFFCTTEGNQGYEAALSAGGSLLAELQPWVEAVRETRYEWAPPKVGWNKGSGEDTRSVFRPAGVWNRMDLHGDDVARYQRLRKAVTEAARHAGPLADLAVRLLAKLKPGDDEVIDYELCQAERELRFVVLWSLESGAEHNGEPTQPPAPVVKGEKPAKQQRAPGGRRAKGETEAKIVQFKAARLADYERRVNEIANAKGPVKRAMIDAARKTYGRDAVAEALGLKGPTVSNSPTWKRMRDALELGKGRGLHKIGLDIATEAASEAAGDTTQDEVTRREYIRLLQDRMPPDAKGRQNITGVIQLLREGAPGAVEIADEALAQLVEDSPAARNDP